MISIVVPLYNKEKVILNTLSTVSSQDYQDWECVIVDDGSTDNSVQVVRDYISSDQRFVLYTKANGGPSSARNYGVHKAKGEWIVFLDADDRFEENALILFDQQIQQHPDFKCFSFKFFTESNGVKTPYFTSEYDGQIANPFKEWYYRRFQPRSGAAVFHKSVLLRHPHKDYLRRFEDAEMLFNIFREYGFYQSSEPVMTYCCNTLAASGVRKDFQEDFLAHLHPKGKPFWEQMILFQFYTASFTLYGNQARIVYSTSPFHPCMEFAIRLKLKMMNLSHRLSNIFNK